MTDYWESRYSKEGAMWKFEPSDSALMALGLFQTNHINHILIPGFGYGRNAKLFCDKGFQVTGIEISKSAIELARANGINCKLHHGSVITMPFENDRYEGIFCYALLHLLNKKERQNFLKACYYQLNQGGLMIFTVISKESVMYKLGKQISSNRILLPNGLKVFFYDSDSINSEFSDFGLLEFKEIDEPIKFMVNEPPMKCIFVVCRKNNIEKI